MATPTYIVTLQSLSTDGNDIFAEMSIFDGLHTFPTIRPTFPSDVTAAQITAYMQTIATARPTLSAALGALVGTTVTG